MSQNTTDYPLPPARCVDGFGPVSCERRFDFTLLFEQSILSVVPSSVFLFLTTLRLYHLYHASKKIVPGSQLLQRAKWVSALLYTALQITLLILWALTPTDPVSVASAVLSVVDSLVLIVLSHLEHAKSIRPSSLINAYLFLSFLFDAAQIRTLYLLPGETYTSVAIVMSASLVVKAAFLCLEAQTKRPFLKARYRTAPPEATAGIWAWSLLWWINGLFRAGYGSLIENEALYGIDDTLSSASVGLRMEEAWNRRTKPESRRSLPFAVASCFQKELLITTIPRALLIALNYAQPFLISGAISLLNESETAENRNSGYGLIGATLIIYVGLAVVTVHYQHRFYRIITMFRGAMVSLIYNHALKVQDGIYDESSALTIMSTDVDRTVNALADVNELWARTIEVGIGIWLLANQVGGLCVVPILVLLICAVSQQWFTHNIGQSQQTWNGAVQRRVAATASMLNSMKAIKMMGISSYLSDVIQTLRLSEIARATSFYGIVIWTNIISRMPITFTPIITLSIYAIKARVQGTESLTTTQAFTSIAIMTLITNPAEMLLVTIPRVTSAMGCFARIQEYLLSECHKDQRSPSRASPQTLSQLQDTDSIANVPGQENNVEMMSIQATLGETSVPAISFHSVALRPTKAAEAVLSDLTFNIESGSLTMIIGRIGTGKTTLLKSMIGEVPNESGSIMTSSVRIAYCGQTSWLINASIQQNICGLALNSAIDERWYRTVLHACDLEQDILDLPDADRSIIGSKGLTLSGGQKQRLALARAVYARQDIVILDDVLSALDSKTASTIMSRLLGPRGLLRQLGTTIVLATHTLNHLSLADKIIVLGNGTILQQGGFAHLAQQPGYLSEMEHDGLLSNEVDGGDRKVGVNEATSPNDGGPTADDEADRTRRTGDVEVYKYYLKSIGWPALCANVLVTAFYAFSFNFPQVWLAKWTSQGGGQLSLYLTVYILLGLGTVVFSYGILYTVFMMIMPKSAVKLHEALLTTVLRAPLSLFARIDSGNILNRFSQDMTIIDMELPVGLSIVVLQVGNVVAQAALISTGSSYMAISIPILLAALYVLQDVYLKTSRQIRFLDLEQKSPLYSHFLETLDGLATIRAFGWQQYAQETNRKRLDASQKPYYMMHCIQRWLALVVDLIVAGLAVTVVALAVSLRGTTTPGLLGVALTTVLTFNQTLSSLVTSWTSLETSLGAIARIRGFVTSTEPEQAHAEMSTPPKDWPSAGAVDIEHVSASYNGSDLVLDDVSIKIAPGEKLGICGRTGSGKSSLLLTLLRLIETSSGRLLIDGLDLSSLPLETIRARITTIPQEPFLLAGSIRSNIDPTASILDEAITDALQKVGLWDTVQGRGGLGAEMMDTSLSQGQQQLFCLARALLQRSKVLVLDEATSNVDMETDRAVQQVLREEFKDCTVIVVAHRLNTIMDSDKIAVLHSGKIVDFGSPTDLLAREGPFRELYGS